MSLASPQDKYHESFVAAARGLLAPLARGATTCDVVPGLRYASVVVGVLNYYTVEEGGDGLWRECVVSRLEAGDEGLATTSELLRVFLLGAELVSASPSTMLQKAADFLLCVKTLAKDDGLLSQLSRLRAARLLAPGDRAPLLPLNGLCHIDLACNLAQFASWCLERPREGFLVSEENVVQLARSWLQFVVSGPLMLTGQARKPLVSCARESLATVASALEASRSILWRGDASGAVAQILGVLSLVAGVQGGAARVVDLSWSPLLWIARSSLGPLVEAELARHRSWAYERAEEAARREAAKRSHRVAYLEAAAYTVRITGGGTSLKRYRPAGR